VCLRETRSYFVPKGSARLAAVEPFLRPRLKGCIVNWEAVGAIGEVIGAFGVIVSLVYLSLQIRRSDKTARA